MFLFLSNGIFISILAIFGKEKMLVKQSNRQQIGNSNFLVEAPWSSISFAYKIIASVFLHP